MSAPNICIPHHVRVRIMHGRVVKGGKLTTVLVVLSFDILSSRSVARGWISFFTITWTSSCTHHQR